MVIPEDLQKKYPKSDWEILEYIYKKLAGIDENSEIKESNPTLWNQIDSIISTWYSKVEKLLGEQPESPLIKNKDALLDFAYASMEENKTYEAEDIDGAAAGVWRSKKGDISFVSKDILQKMVEN